MPSSVALILMRHAQISFLIPGVEYQTFLDHEERSETLNLSIWRPLTPSLVLSLLPV